MIFDCGALALSADEIAFFRNERPWGFILFARNISELAQLADLITALCETVGRPRAPVMIDQEGGRVQRIKLPILQPYPSGAKLRQIYLRDNRWQGARAADIVAVDCDMVLHSNGVMGEI